jgi:hypothetical protein
MAQAAVPCRGPFRAFPGGNKFSYILPLCTRKLSVVGSKGDLTRTFIFFLGGAGIKVLHLKVRPTELLEWRTQRLFERGIEGNCCKAYKIKEELEIDWWLLPMRFWSP